MGSKPFVRDQIGNRGFIDKRVGIRKIPVKGIEQRGTSDAPVFIIRRKTIPVGRKQPEKPPCGWRGSKQPEGSEVPAGNVKKDAIIEKPIKYRMLSSRDFL